MVKPKKAILRSQKKSPDGKKRTKCIKIGKFLFCSAQRLCHATSWRGLSCERLLIRMQQRRLRREAVQHIRRLADPQRSRRVDRLHDVRPRRRHPHAGKDDCQTPARPTEPGALARPMQELPEVLTIDDFGGPRNTRKRKKRYKSATGKKRVKRARTCLDTC